MTDHTCLNPECGATFVGRRRKFCPGCLPEHAAVGHKAYQDRYGELNRVLLGYVPRTCSVCGELHQVRTSGGRCWSCVKAANKRCTSCDAVFTGVDGRAKCSACRTALCTECGLPFESSRGRRLCSDLCRELRRVRVKNQQARRRRLRRRGAIKGPYHDLEMFDRDGWRCQICKKLTRPWHRVPHPLAPTIDHIVPLDADGSDTADNVQCAHFACNSGKGPRAANDQLRLVG